MLQPQRLWVQIILPIKEKARAFKKKKKKETASIKIHTSEKKKRVPFFGIRKRQERAYPLNPATQMIKTLQTSKVQIDATRNLNSRLHYDIKQSSLDAWMPSNKIQQEFQRGRLCAKP